MARPIVPQSRWTSASTVGLPRLSRTSRALRARMVALLMEWLSLGSWDEQSLNRARRRCVLDDSLLMGYGTGELGQDRERFRPAPAGVSFIGTVRASASR